MGTPAFMAPEQARGRWEEVDGQTDLWALGATLFTLLTGAYVHEGQTVNETLALAVTQPARPIRTVRPDLPERAAALIDRALAYAKPQRFADARAMQAEVRLVYAASSGGDVSRAAQLSVPDAERSARSQQVAATTDPRLRQTTARGVSASGLPAPLRDAWQVPRNRRLLLAGGGAALLLVLAVLARNCAGVEPEVASLAPAAAALQAVAPVAAPSVAAPEAASAVPQVSIDELPRERKRKAGEGRPAAGAGAATPAKKDDPFARRR